MPKPQAPKSDKQMILSPDEWPRWPFLPMIKRMDDNACGVIVGDPFNGHVWFIDDAYIFRIDERDYKRARRVKIDELLLEGWEID